MIRLLSTDFDGTLVSEREGEKCLPQLATELKAAVDGGALWAVNTGRPLWAALKGLNELQAPVSPDFILTSERHVHKPDGHGGWHDYGEWNAICRRHHDLLFKECGTFFEKIERIVERYPGVYFQDTVDSVPGGIVAPEEKVLDEVIRQISELPGRPADFHFQRSNEYLRFCHRAYDKGTALAELSRLLEMPAMAILAVGDHQNDLAMLFGDVAGMVACPANAHSSVKETVLNAGGHVSILEAAEGTAEAIHLYRTGKKRPVERKTGSAF